MFLESTLCVSWTANQLLRAHFHDLGLWDVLDLPDAYQIANFEACNAEFCILHAFGLTNTIPISAKVFSYDSTVKFVQGLDTARHLYLFFNYYTLQTEKKKNNLTYKENNNNNNDWMLVK